MTLKALLLIHGIYTFFYSVTFEKTYIILGALYCALSCMSSYKRLQIYLWDKFNLQINDATFNENVGHLEALKPDDMPLSRSHAHGSLPRRKDN